MIVYGPLDIAGAETGTVDPVADLFAGREFYRTDTTTLKIYDGSAWKTVAIIDKTQVLTNKDYDGAAASNTSRITVPKATKATLDALARKEGTIVWATDLKKFFIDDGTVLVEVGSGSGGGGGAINHITNSDAEVDARGWAASAAAAIA